MTPVIEVRRMLTELIFFIPNKNFGKDPLNWFSESSKDLNDVKLDNNDGILPVNLFMAKSRVDSWVIVDNDCGILPLN
jgi:hypothetical protein